MMVILIITVMKDDDHNKAEYENQNYCNEYDESDDDAIDEDRILVVATIMMEAGEL